MRDCEKLQRITEKLYFLRKYLVNDRHFGTPLSVHHSCHRRWKRSCNCIPPKLLEAHLSRLVQVLLSKSAQSCFPHFSWEAPLLIFSFFFISILGIGRILKCHSLSGVFVGCAEAVAAHAHTRAAPMHPPTRLCCCPGGVFLAATGPSRAQTNLAGGEAACNLVLILLFFFFFYDGRLL